MINKTRERMQKYKNINIDIMNVDIKDFQYKTKYDLIIAAFVLNFIPDFQNVLQKMVDKISHRGFLLFAMY